MLKVPCISVRQPWSELIVAGIKNVENRSRISHYRGLLLIHSSKKIDCKWSNRLSDDGVDIVKKHLKSISTPIESLKRGCIVGMVNQYGCVNPYHLCLSVWHEPEFYGLLFRDSVRFDKPIPYNGQLGIFNANIDQNLLPIYVLKIIMDVNNAN